MSDASAVVLGALIGFGASVIGTLVTSFFAPLIFRRQERRATSIDEISVQTRDRIQTIAGLIDDWVDAWRDDNSAEVERIQRLIHSENIRLRLWTNGDDRPVAGNVYRVLGADSFEESVIRGHAWQEVATEWYRKAIKGSDFELAYKITEDAARDLAAGIRKEREADAAVRADARQPSRRLLSVLEGVRERLGR